MGVLGPGLTLGLLLAGVGLLALVFWPRWGVVARRRRSEGLRDRMQSEDTLKHLYKAELNECRPTLQSVAGASQVSLTRAAEVMGRLQRSGLAEVAGDELRLSATGRQYALNIVRAHRLWEQHLAEQTGVAESKWHREAERQEHFISPEEADRLAARLGHPAYDPHGDPIPTPDGRFAPGAGQPLASLAPGQWGRILHVEDEPESVYAQIRAMNLYPGTVVRLLENTPQRLRILANGEEQVLAPVVAANLTLLPLAPEEPAEIPGSRPLASLRVGEAATVVQLSRKCRGAERRRLMDLGILPGTRIAAEMASPAGRLTAYRVRETLIALRDEQAAMILVEPAGKESP